MTQHSDFLWITEQQILNDYCEQASQAEVLALDTEFVRTRTLYAELGLLQVNDGKSIALIDPTCELDLEPFWRLLTDESIVKVLHSCHEDLEVFKVYAKRLPSPLFDTQIAGQFLNQGKVIGFGAIVAQELNVTLDKDSARTNWLKRPLTPQQLNYAVNDVKYLLPLYQTLNQKLIQQGLEEYNLAEAKFKVSLKQKNKNVDLLYMDFGNAWQLNSRELEVLNRLSQWRLQVAQKKNLALGFVVQDATLFLLAKRKPADLNSMKNIPEINPHEVRIHGASMLACIKAAKQVAAEQCPEPIPRLTDFPQYKQAFKALKQSITKVAEENNIPLPIMATKRLLNQWISWCWQVPNTELPDFSESWRHELLATPLQQWREKYPVTKAINNSKS